MLNEELHVIVYGQVHGIGFRARTKEHAESLELKGFVRNLSDGTVEICAQGEKQKLDVLLQKLKDDFGKKHIEKIEVSFRQPSTHFDKFRITLA